MHFFVMLISINLPFFYSLSPVSSTYEKHFSLHSISFCRLCLSMFHFREEWDKPFFTIYERWYDVRDKNYIYVFMLFMECKREESCDYFGRYLSWILIDLWIKPLVLWNFILFVTFRSLYCYFEYHFFSVFSEKILKSLLKNFLNICR